MKKIKWGIISTGTIAHAFAQDFKYVKQGELVAVASRNQNTAQAFADQYQIPKAYGSYEELYADSDIDAIYVATPHSLHLAEFSGSLRSWKGGALRKAHYH